VLENQTDNPRVGMQVAAQCGQTRNSNDRQIKRYPVRKNPPQVLVDCNGVGYEVDVPMSTFYNLGEVGQPISLLTHFVVREDAQLLYGFATAPERHAFKHLIKISGVGPRMALAVLSGMSVTDLINTVASQDTARIVKVPGIGKKTAERLMLELKGKLGDGVSIGFSFTSDNQGDILPSRC